MVVTSQLRKSGGFWLSLAGKNILVDPGPGSLMRSVELGLKPAHLDCIVLSHKHIDHSNDVNIMIEAMSGGSFRPRGMLLAPSDALEGDDPVVLRYVRNYIRNNIKVLEPGFKCSLDGVTVEVVIRMTHADVEAYGLKFSFDGKTLGYVTDTKFFSGLPEAFKGCDYLIVNMVRMTHDARFEHLLPEDVIRVLKVAKPPPGHPQPLRPAGRQGKTRSRGPAHRKGVQSPHHRRRRRHAVQLRHWQSSYRAYHQQLQLIQANYSQTFYHGGIAPYPDN